jgi:flagellar motor switch protein FliN
MSSLGATVEPVGIELEVLLGETRMPVHQLLRMGRGAVIQLGATNDDDVTVLANDVPVARASVTVDGSKISIAITRMLARPPELRD